MLAVMEAMERQAPDPGDLDRLLTATAAGDTEAFGELYQRTRGAVYAMTLSVVRNAHDAQDLTQDVFVRVWESSGQYHARGSPMAWILTIGRNLARMRLRQASRTGELSDEEWDAIPVDAPDVTVEDRVLLQDALAALGAEERQILLLHASSGLKHREIAALLEMPIATVLSKYHRALKKLRARMEGDERP